MNGMQDNGQRKSMDLPGQVVLVLQGGGALGSYQAGVYQALHEAGIEPDWIIGTSIGAINASLIAGNAPRTAGAPEGVLEADGAESGLELGARFPTSTRSSLLVDVTNGIPGFFRPNRWRMRAIPIRSAPITPASIRPRRWSGR
jgi:NTE family protein